MILFKTPSFVEGYVGIKCSGSGPLQPVFWKNHTIKYVISSFWVALYKNCLFSQISVTIYLVVVYSLFLHTFEICCSVPLETKDLIQRPLKAMGVFPPTSNGIWVKTVYIIVSNKDLTAIVVFRIFHETFQNCRKNCLGLMLQNTDLSMNHVLLFCFKKRGGGGGGCSAGWLSKELYRTGAPNECSVNKKEGMLGQYLVCSWCITLCVLYLN